MQLKIVDAFVDGASGGNPAGLVLDADELTALQKQRIAARAGLSETAFVSKSKIADFKLEFFTPTRQIAHCGHATIATFCVLRQLGRISGAHSSKETIDGTRAIIFEGEKAFMEQKAPRYIQTRSEILSSLGLGPEQLLDGCEPVVVNTGNSFALVGVKDEKALLAVVPDFDAVTRVSEELDLVGYYVFTRQTKIRGRHAAARMFAPRYGIREESATGMAAGPLACLLFDRFGMKQTELVIEQGTLMTPSSPSVLTARLIVEGGLIKSVMVGGAARVQKTLDIPVTGEFYTDSNRVQ